MAVFLATDTYDKEDDTISATSLLKSTRKLILAGRVPEQLNVTDIKDLTASRIGTAIHDAIERSWVNDPTPALKALGYPQHYIDRVVVNPVPGSLGPDDVPIYLEQRAYKEVGGMKVSGKFDVVHDGRLEDVKTTSTYVYLNGVNDKDYMYQGSIYRWLNPDLVTEDDMHILFYLKDWAASKAYSDPNYPLVPTPSKLIPLMSVEETDQFVKAKIAELQRYADSPEKDLPFCSDDDLWRTQPQWKWYSKPENKNCQKKFTSKQAAYQHLAEKGKGIVVEAKGEVKACKYCPAYPLCTQKDTYLADGSLKT
jgi:hypothetical protein